MEKFAPLEHFPRRFGACKQTTSTDDCHCLCQVSWKCIDNSLRLLRTNTATQKSKSNESSTIMIKHVYKKLQSHHQSKTPKWPF